MKRIFAKKTFLKKIWLFSRDCIYFSNR